MRQSVDDAVLWRAVDEWMGCGKAEAEDAAFIAGGDEVAEGSVVEAVVVLLL